MQRPFTRLAGISASLLLIAVGAARAEAPGQGPGHVTGLGGVFITAKDPKALAAWYRDVLGVPIEAWGGAAFHRDAEGAPPAVAFTVMPEGAKYLRPSQRDVMLDFVVDDMEAMVARLKAHGVEILGRDASDPGGEFLWLLDPEGRKIELWRPGKR
jgi:predicted enzyme related to lactoylglutathione lyase